MLVVNDDLFFSGRILSVLEKGGYRTLSAVTPGDALNQIRQSKPALVILNLGSKRLGGAELIRRIKAEPVSPMVLAFISHTLIPNVRDEVMAAGADRICANSAVSMRLPQIVEEVLEGKSNHEETKDE